MDVAAAKRLRVLEGENHMLKKLPGDPDMHTFLMLISEQSRLAPRLSPQPFRC